MFQDNSSKKNVSDSQTISVLEITIGGFFTTIFGLTFLGCIIDILSSDRTTKTGEFVGVMIVLATSLFFLICGIDRSSLIRKYRRYIPLLYQRPSHSIDQLAEMLEASVSTVRSDLMSLIERHYIADAYIDDKSNRIICTQNSQVPKPMTKPGPASITNSISHTVSTAQSQKPPECMTLTCKFCGAPNKMVKGVAQECEYCGVSIIWR